MDRKFFSSVWRRKVSNPESCLGDLKGDRQDSVPLSCSKLRFCATQPEPAIVCTTQLRMIARSVLSEVRMEKSLNSKRALNKRKKRNS